MACRPSRFAVCLVALTLLPALAGAQPPAPAGRVKVSSGAASLVGNAQVVPAPIGNPVVPTPDNTSEARNRRVEVTVR